MKKTITKQLMALLAFVMLFTNVSAQTDKKVYFDDLMKNSTNIFEGKAISSKCFRSETGGIFTSVIVEVQGVVKGSIQKGTIEIILNGGRLDGETDLSSHPIMLPIGTGLYFCSEAEKSVSNSKIQNANTKSLRVQEVVEFNKNEVTASTEGIGKYFSSVTDLYNYLKNTYAINIDKELLEKKSPQITRENKIEISSNINDISYEQKLKNNKEYKEKRSIKVAERNANNASSTSATCAEIFLSEYLNGTNKNKAIEIYNPTSSTKNLAGYSILIFPSGSISPTTINLTGTVASKGTYVVANPQASSAVLARANKTDANMTLTGNETVVLQSPSAPIDKIGDMGTIVTNGWPVTSTATTKAHDLRRQFPIAAGNVGAWSSVKTQWTALAPDSLSNVGKHINSCASVTSGTTLLLDLANQQVTGTNATGRYFEYDVTGASSVPTYLDNCLLKIQYNSAAFGNNAISGGRVTITNGASFNSATYINCQANAVDVSPDTLDIPFGTDYTQSSWNRTQLTTTPKILAHIKMKIQSCGNSANVYYTDQINASNLSFYTTTSNDSPFNSVSYDNTTYTGGFNDILCNMTITDFTQPINAGVQNTLTITGTDFGASRGSGYVRFVNTDACCGSKVKLSARDYISWSDNQIVINLPSFVDSVAVPLHNQVTIGGGNFLVRNNAGDSMVSSINASSQSFNVYYGINQIWSYSDDQKNEVELRNQNGLGGYTLRLNPTDFPVGSNKRNIFAKALRDWKCMTGVNINIGRDTTIANFNPFTSNGINYVSFSSTLLGGSTNSTVAETDLITIACGNDISAVLKKADMTFNANKTFIYDSTSMIVVATGESDFYGTVLHELGHFIGLRHHSDPNNLMYWTGNAGPLNGATVKRLALSISPVDGGNFSVTQGNTVASSCTGFPVMISQNASCSNPNGINEYSMNNYYFNLYPNPSNGSSINIEFQALTDSDAQIEIYDMVGRVVYSANLNNRNDITSNYELNVSNLNSGMYFVNLIIDKVKVSHKLIRN